MNNRFDIPPRLRLNRQASSFNATVDDSHFYATFNLEREASDDGDDDGSTPRIGMSKASVDSIDEPLLHISAQAQAQSTPAPGRDATPAERLRAVLSRASSATPTLRANNMALLERTPSNGTAMLESDMESEDFETPRNVANGIPATPYSNTNSISSSLGKSVARESVRNIFERALRSPGNTPDRPRRPRRGSMDSSFAEDSPIRWSMMRAGEKAKRLSLSDDEKERIRTARAGDESTVESFKSSQAATYNQLRERLENSSAGAGTSKAVSSTKSDMTIDMEEATEVEVELFKERKVPIRSSTPPVPPSTSMSQFPSQFLGSNLLTDNSDMRRMIEEAQAETTDSEAPESNHTDNRTPIAGPSSDGVNARPSFVRERTLSRTSSVGSQGSSSSRPTSRQSMNDSEDPDRKRERERGWNHPLGPYMERHRATSPLFPVNRSGGFARIRKASLSSISGAESDAGRSSPLSSAKRQTSQQINGNGHPGAKYIGLSTSQHPSSSPNQLRVSPRIRTVSQPAKPSSPGSLRNSTNSDGTQQPLDRTRTVSLTVRDISRPSSSRPLVRSSSGHGHNGIRGMDQAGRSSPSSSRPLSRSSSRASSRQSEEPNSPDQPHIRERNWSSAHSKRSVTASPSLASERRRPGNAALVRTPPTEVTSRSTAPHATNTSPSSIPRPSVYGRSHSARLADTGKGSKANTPNSRNSSSPLTAISPNTLGNGKYTSSSKEKNARQPAISKVEHKAPSYREYESTPSHTKFPTPSPEINDVEEPEEHDTPKIGQQHFPESPTRGTGPFSNRVGISSGFSSHSASNGDDRVDAPGTASVSVIEKERYRKDAEQRRNAQPPKVSVPLEPIDLRDSDLDSFQDEDIVASSSAPRLRNGDDSFGENDESSQSEEAHADYDVLRPQQDVRLNGFTGNLAGKRSSLLVTHFSPPPSPPISPPDPITTTPQRPVTGNTSKVEFRTPSPPKGMPALPDPPSSDESDRTPPVPVTPAGRNRYADMKTPRPPGAWSTPFATSAPAAAARMITIRDSQSEKNQVQTQNEIHTPPASYSRATLKTPAPPGAWLQTPATIAAKRLQQRVRFGEQKTSAPPAPVPAGDDGTLTSDISAGDGSVAMKATGRTKLTSPRTAGRIRVVDAFGNEIVPPKSEDRTEKRPHQRFDELHATGKDEKDVSESRKTRIRVLDAMGREIDATQVRSVTVASTVDKSAKQSIKAEGENVTVLFQELDGEKLERKQALLLLQKTIAELKDDFNRTDDPVFTQRTDKIDAQIADLKAQSIRAKEDRARLMQKIRKVNTPGLLSRWRAAWNTLLHDKNGPTSSTRSTYFKAFLVLVFLQVVIFCAFYRLTSLGARQLFLTTYIDPFYPELYLHVTNPDYLHLSMPSQAHLGVDSPASPSTWAYAFLASWHATLDRITTLRESVWDVWRGPPRSMPWPPT